MRFLHVKNFFAFFCYLHYIPRDSSGGATIADWQSIGMERPLSSGNRRGWMAALQVAEVREFRADDIYGFAGRTPC